MKNCLFTASIIVLSAQALENPFSDSGPEGRRDLIFSELGQDTYLHALNMTVGTPEQPSQFLVDLNSAMTHVFGRYARTGRSRFDKFYNRRMSSTSWYLNRVHDFQSSTCGFDMMTYYASETMCFDGLEYNENLMSCFGGDMYEVYQIENQWNTEQDLRNLGGLLGVGRNDTNHSMAFWRYAAQDVERIDLRMRPASGDLSWLEGYENTDSESYITIQGQEWAGSFQLKSESDTQWVFGLDQLLFGSKVDDISLLTPQTRLLRQEQQQSDQKKPVNQSEQISNSTVEVVEEKINAQLSLALNGIGLPRENYLTFISKIKQKFPSVLCKQTTGSSCVASNTICSDLKDTFADYRFQMRFTQKKGWQLSLPIEQFLRQNSDGSCEILVTNLRDEQAENIVLGDAVLQALDTQLQFKSNGKNVLSLQLQPQDQLVSGTELTKTNMILPLEIEVGLGIGVWIVLGLGVLCIVVACIGVRKVRDQRKKRMALLDMGRQRQIVFEENAEQLIQEEQENKDVESGIIQETVDLLQTETVLNEDRDEEIAEDDKVGAGESEF